MTQLLTYLLTQRRTSCHTHIGLFTFASWLSKTSTAAISEISLLRGLIAPKPYVPHQNSRMHERQILRMVISPRNDSHFPKLCPLSCTHITNTPSKVPIFSYFWTCKTPAQKFGNFSTIYACMHRFTFFISKKAQNRCRINGRKSSLYWWQKKTKRFLASLGGTPGAICPDFLRECTPWPLTYIPGFTQIRSGLGI